MLGSLIISEYLEFFPSLVSRVVIIFFFLLAIRRISLVDRPGVLKKSRMLLCTC